MPYIPEEARDELIERYPEEPGELAYAIAVAVDQYVQWIESQKAVRGFHPNTLSYAERSQLIGTLDTVVHELKRRLMDGYETRKRAANGDVLLGDSWGTSS